MEKENTYTNTPTGENERIRTATWDNFSYRKHQKELMMLIKDINSFMEILQRHIKEETINLRVTKDLKNKVFDQFDS